MEIRNRPWTDLAKLIRVIESCETEGQLSVMANKMWWVYAKKYPSTNNHNYGLINKTYIVKLKELNELEDELEEGGLCD